MAPYFHPTFFDYVLTGLICGLVWVTVGYALWSHFTEGRSRSHHDHSSENSSE